MNLRRRFQERDREYLANTLYDLRVNAGMTQAQLAKLLGLSHYTVSSWELGKCYPRVDTLPRLAAALGVTVADLRPKRQEADVA